MDCAINLRVHSIRYEKIPREVYIYRNVFYQSPDFGMQIFFSTSSGYPDSPEVIWIYNNTIYKSAAWGNPMAFYRSYGDKKKHPVRILNNLMYLNNPPFKQNFEIFSGNMLPDSAKETVLSGDFGSNTMMKIDKSLFEREMDGKFVELVPAGNSALVKKGMDLGKEFTIGNVKYPALPGMVAGDTTIGARRAGETLEFQKKMFDKSEKIFAE